MMAGVTMLDALLPKIRLQTMSSSPKPGWVWPTVMNCLNPPAAAPKACQASSKKRPSRG